MIPIAVNGGFDTSSAGYPPHPKEAEIYVRFSLDLRLNENWTFSP
jgi:hypothetical protein